jgi:hypothetical protein
MWPFIRSALITGVNLHFKVWDDRVVIGFENILELLDEVASLGLLCWGEVFSVKSDLGVGGAVAMKGCCDGDSGMPGYLLAGAVEADQVPVLWKR